MNLEPRAPSRLRRTLAMAVCASLFSCAPDGESPGPSGSTARRALEELERLGLYAYVSEEAVRRSRAEVLKSGWPLAGDHGRDFMADSEDLAEGGVGRFLDEIRPFLERQRVAFGAVTEDVTDRGYSVTVDGRRTAILTADELDPQTGADLWRLAAARTFGLVNGLLERVGSSERAYALYGGNDLRAVFLSPELFQAVRRYPGVEPRDLPYAPEASPSR